MSGETDSVNVLYFDGADFIWEFTVSLLGFDSTSSTERKECGSGFSSCWWGVRWVTPQITATKETTMFLSQLKYKGRR